MKSIIAVLSAAALYAGAALAQSPPPIVVTQPLQSGAVTGGTSSTVSPRLNGDKKDDDKKDSAKKDGATASQQPPTGERK